MSLIGCLVIRDCYEEFLYVVSHDFIMISCSALHYYGSPEPEEEESEQEVVASA